MTRQKPHVVVVGGGITGLAAGYALQQQAAEQNVSLTCTLVEAGKQWGGKIETRRAKDYLIEAGPDSFLSQKPWALELCNKLGLSDQIINTNPTDKKAFVYSRGQLRELPEGLVVIVPTKIWPFLKSGLVSFSGILRMGLDLVRPPRYFGAEESLADFFTRRFGVEAFERLIEPLMAGIYAGDAHRMSIRATFPRFYDMERTQGSLIRGMMKAMSPPGSKSGTSQTPRTLFVSLRNGLDTLVRALVSAMERNGTVLRLGTQVRTIRPMDRVVPAQPGSRGYQIMLGSGELFHADAVIFTTPAFVTGHCLKGVDRLLADRFFEIPYASTATVSLAYDRSALSPSVRGFGFVVPRVEGRRLLAATWSSNKWSDRAPAEQLLVRCYLGGVGREELLDRDDETLAWLCQQELRDMAGITAAPRYMEVNRWPLAMPQYNLGHLALIAEIEQGLASHPGLAVAGAAYRGIGIPDCIKDGTDQAHHIVEYVRSLQVAGRA